MRKLRAIWKIIWCNSFYLYFDGFRMQSNCRVSDMRLIKEDAIELTEAAITDAQQDANLKTVKELIS